MGLRKALSREREQESALAEKLPLHAILAIEMDHNRKSWLERANIHLEAKLEKANKDLDLQRRMTKKYSQRNQFTRKKLKISQNEVLVLKKEKYQASLDIFARDSLQVSQDP